MHWKKLMKTLTFLISMCSCKKKKEREEGRKDNLKKRKPWVVLKELKLKLGECNKHPTKSVRIISAFKVLCRFLWGPEFSFFAVCDVKTLF